MIDTNLAIEVMNDDDLLACTRELVRQSCATEADLLLHLAEIDERKLYVQRAFPSMVAFCRKELGFSQGAAYNRIGVARAARRWPAVLEALRSGAVHLAGLRVLVPHLTDQNHERILGDARGKSKREIEEIAARLSPKPPVPDRMRRLPQRLAATLFESVARSVPATSADPIASTGTAEPVPAIRREERRPVMAPLSEDTFEIRFTAPRSVRDKLRQAQDLLRHRVPGNELAVVVDKALDALIEKLKKERFGVGTRSRNQSAPGQHARAPSAFPSRHIPAAIRRAVYERAGGRCEFVDEKERRCSETGGLEFDHLDGFARTHVHDLNSIRLLCHGHNLHAAEQMYGRAFMDRVRRERGETRSSAPPRIAASVPMRAASATPIEQQSLF